MIFTVSLTTFHRDIGKINRSEHIIHLVEVCNGVGVETLQNVYTSFPSLFKDQVVS